MFNSINVSASGLTAERLRMDVISRNIANANVTRTATGTPYRRQVPIFKSQSSKSFRDVFDTSVSKLANNFEGVEVVDVVDDMSAFKEVYNPNHPDADERGIVLMPNVDTVTEMINLISASRSYEANVTSLNTAKSMAMKALELGR